MAIIQKPVAINEEVTERENNTEEPNKDNNHSEVGQEVIDNEKVEEDTEIDDTYSLPSEYNYDNRFELIKDINEFIFEENDNINGNTQEVEEKVKMSQKLKVIVVKQVIIKEKMKI
ncbi:hypothetical protein PL321_07450 [Caloramator sp. mosi_1]|uniref:hypothetical protein n=1 Tax=Caloramator sp. mosi_1 TaxID=3023090 RepID=UPI00235EAB5B|nr:hypothetical protein [Caloramator sp. mosi_1]WDC85273.1 hypothetical protein PL321_07450 [Caloramator sp. mosi_1]